MLPAAIGKTRRVGNCFLKTTNWLDELVVRDDDTMAWQKRGNRKEIRDNLEEDEA